jgi:galactokinase/mevalonate kinase-like predicted kinase
VYHHPRSSGSSGSHTPYLDGSVTDAAIALYAVAERFFKKIKKSRSPSSTTTAIDELYDLGIKNGASAGKVVGAGGGGFLLFLTKDRPRLKLAMIAQGLSEMPFRFTSEGTTVRSFL